MKRTELRRSPMPSRRTPLSSRSTLARKPLAAVSAKRQQQNRTYTRLRREFLESRPRCEFPRDCPERATEVQHLRGRRGERLNDTAWWAASCHDHNAWAEDHTGEALTIGWLIRIEGVA